VARHVATGGWPVLVVPAPAAAPRSPADVLDSLVGALPQDRDLVLVPHSGAGPYMAAVADHRRVRAVVFVDAGLPRQTEPTPTAPPALRGLLAARAGLDGRLPPWTEWWDADDVAPLFPDDQTRARVEAQQLRLPLAYFSDAVPAATGRQVPAGAYLAFGGTYADEAATAQRRGWPVRSLSGGHLHMLQDPPAVAGALVDLLAALGQRSEAAT
jgi:pimeloyl-ACP methyl ester carboxylesterase